MPSLPALLAGALLLAGIFAPSAGAQQEIVDQFEQRSMTANGYTMPYRLFVPADYDPSIAYPLVLALHGAGERGTDNERHIRLHRLATSWADPANQAEHPAFVVAPQVPPGDRWSAERPVDESGFSNAELTTLAILDSLARAFTLDPNRFYITGLSMGGHGTWDLIARLPHRFAAAIPMSGNADPTQADDVLHLPIWAFHGETDTVVRPRSARAFIQRLEDLGREVIYTDCRRAPVAEVNYDCPGTISTSALAEAVANRADLIYTSVRNRGHGPWDVWYDHPLLADWLFAQRRVVPDTLTLTAPAADAVWTGDQAVTWTTTSSPTDSAEVWLSLDDGTTWERLATVPADAGRYTLATTDYPDAAVARVRVFLLDADGRVYGNVTSAPFRLDHAGNAPPYLAVDDERLRFEPDVTAETLDLPVQAADPEGAPLTIEVFYSLDDGATFLRALTTELPSSPVPQTLTLDVAALPNSAEARLRVVVSDGATTAEATTAAFIKATPRLANDYVERIAGEGVGTITLHFIDPSALTNHRYRITFDDSDPAAKTYTVVDQDLGTTVLTGVPLSDGVRESPIFDGMSLVVEDLPEGRPNLEATGWIKGDTDLGVAIAGGTVRIFVLSVDFLDTEDDYELTVTNAVADTSVAMFTIPARELYFTVTARSDGERRKVVYRDAAGDGRLGSSDVMYLLEPDADGELAPAWEFRFSATNDTVLPEAGDTFLFVPQRSLSSADIFELIAREGVRTDASPTPDAFTLQPGYPNPFTDRVTLAYRLAQPSHVTLAVYDLLGRRVATLVDGLQPAGQHTVRFDARDLASGVYVYRLAAGTSTETRTMVLLR